MITVIPIHKNHLAGHFTKAELFQFVDDKGIVVGSCVNPLLGTACAEKHNLLSIFESYQVDRIIVWNIGERMLDKLISKSMRVYKALNPRQTLDEFAYSATENLMELTVSSQGRPSRNYDAKQKTKSDCCCESQSDSSSCCGRKSTSSCH